MISNVKKIWQEECRPQQPLEPSSTQPTTLMNQSVRRTQIGRTTSMPYITNSTTSFGNVDSAILWLEGPKNFSQVSLNRRLISSQSLRCQSLGRVLSQAKFTLTPSRNRLSDETLEIHELLRHWWVNNTIAQQRGGRGRPTASENTTNCW